jgi:hypothetical protein
VQAKDWTQIIGFRHNIELVAVFRVLRAWWQLSRDIPADAGFLCRRGFQAQGHDKMTLLLTSLCGQRESTGPYPGWRVTEGK